jgi:DNA-binding response OmpR family regulator
MLGGRQISLTRQEYRLKYLLAARLGLVITHQQLTKDIWGDSSRENVQYLRTLIRRLCEKLEVDPSQPKLLISEAALGYRLEPIAVLSPRSNSSKWADCDALIMSWTERRRGTE